MAKQRQQLSSSAKTNDSYLKGYVYHRALFNHNGNKELFIRRLGHLARRDPNKRYKPQSDSQLDPTNWNITIFHEDIVLENGETIAPDSLSISNVDFPEPVMRNNPLHSWIRISGKCCPSIWEAFEYQPGTIVSGIESQPVKQCIQNIYNELIGHREQDPTALKPLVQLFLYECRRGTKPEPDSLPPALQRILQLLSEDNGMCMSITELAAVAGCSSRQLSRLCQQYLARSPVEVRRQQRLHRASELLSDPTRNLSGIAHQVGYADAFSLSKAYRKAFGHSPRK